MPIVLGVLIGFALIGLAEVVAREIATLRARKFGRDEINEFCRKKDYCVYGCGRGGEGYYGGYNCPSDHK